MKLLRWSILVLAYLCLHTFETKAQWTQTGLTNLSVTSFAVSGTNLFAGTNSGVFLSTNNGTSWTAHGLTNTVVTCLAVSGTNLFAGTHSGVFLSTNSDTSWTAASTGLTSTEVWGGLIFTSTDVRALAVSGTNLVAGKYISYTPPTPMLVYGGGVFLSTNNGTSWVSTGLTTTWVDAFAVSGTNLFAGTGGGRVCLSTDNGTSWTGAAGGIAGPDPVYVLAVSGTNLFAGTYSGVRLSTNNGTSWTAVNTGLGDVLNPPSINALAVSGTNLFAGGNGAFLSANNGTSWAAVNSGLTNTGVKVLAVAGTYLFAGTDRGVFRRGLNDWMLLLAPVNGLCGVTLPATFKWKTNPQALTYAFQISANADFSNLLINQYTTDTIYTTSNLQLATMYYWRVRAENATGATEWGYGSFTTKLTGAPQLSSPVSGATLVSVTPTLSWTSVASTATYTLQLSTRPAFDTLVFSMDATGTSIVSSQLQRSTTYYWRVRAQTVGDTTAWSSVSSFTTLLNAPNGITLVYPDSGKQDAYENDWLIWQGDNTATAYLIQISQGPLFTSIFDSATVKSAGYRNAKKVFTSGSIYYWRVRGSNAGGDGLFSSVWSFRVVGAVRVPVISYSSSNLVFGRLKVGQFKDTVVTISNNGTDSLKISSISSTVSAFSVRQAAAIIPPGKPLFIDTIRFAPTLGGNVNASIVLKSNAATSPDSIKVSGFGLSYSLRVSTARVDMGLVLLGKYKDTTFTITNTGSDTLKIIGISTTIRGITARPTAMNILPNGFATDTIRFGPTVLGPVSGSIIITSNAPTSPDSVKVTASGVTATTGIVEEGIPTEFGLRQNYPNPFNPSTTIRYEMPIAANVSLRIYNTLGQLLASLVDEHKVAGSYQVQWNANVPSGIYFYRLQAGEYVETKKMILLR